MPVALHDKGAAIGVAELDRNGEMVEAQFEELRRAEMPEIVPASVAQLRRRPDLVPRPGVRPLYQRIAARAGGLRRWDGLFDDDDGNPPAELTPDDVIAPDTVAEPTWPVDEVKAKIAARAAVGAVTLTAAQAKEVAKQCLWQAAAAALEAEVECKNRPILVTGYTTPESTEHDIEALASNISWSQLHWKTTVPPPGWYNEVDSDCLGNTGGLTGNDCDEFPFGRTYEGGPGKGVSLKPVASADNQDQGLAYAHLTACPGITPIEDGDFENASFFVLPFLTLPTMPIC
jgi:hypothetical protein